MEKNLLNKIVVITGGAQGIGLEIAKNFLKKNAQVIIILDVDENMGQEAVKYLNGKYGDGKSYFIKCDVTKDLESASKIIFEKYDYVDVLVNNAGVIDEVNEVRSIDINVTSLIQWSYKFYDLMRKDTGGKGGTIINLASIYGFRIDPFLPIYKATKYAVMGFTRTLGHSYNFERTAVRVFAICPGFTKTPLVSNMKMRNEKEEALRKHMIKFLETETLWQNQDSVGRAAAEAFEIADSGTAWLIEGDKPIKEVL